MSLEQNTMSFEQLTQRLLDFQATTTQLHSLITRLATLHLPPGAVPPTSSGAENPVSELSNEIHDTLKEQFEDLELLEQEIHDLAGGRRGSDAEARKGQMVQRAAQAGQDLKAARSAFRSAQLVAKRNLDQSRRAERALLLHSLVSPDPHTPPSALARRRSPEPSQDEKLVGAAGDVTAALRQTHSLMATELSRSQFAHDTLNESTAALSQLSDTYSSLDSVLASTKSLLGTLLHSQKSDTWYLETAFYVLAATVGWLVWRRLLYGPMWWFVYLPLKLAWNVLMGLFTLVGLRGGASASVSQGGGQTMATSLIPGSTVVQATMSGTDAPRAEPTGRPSNPLPPRAEGERSYVESVGEMTDETRRQEQGQAPQHDNHRGEQEHGNHREQPEHGNHRGEQPEEQVQRNPKKRVWDEEVESKKREEEQRGAQKDEL